MANPNPSDLLWHFVCPECEFDDGELGRLLPYGTHYCPICAEDNGRDVRLTLTHSQEFRGDQ